MGMLTKSKNGAYIVPGIASVFLPGLGQLFKGHIGKGIGFMLVFFGWGLITFIPSILPLSGLWLPIVALLAWAINVLDAAFNSAGQRG